MPRGKTTSSRLRELLDEKAGKPIKVVTRRDELAKLIYDEAMAAKQYFVETLLDRTEGKVPTPQPEPELDVEDALDDALDEPPAETGGGPAQVSE